MLARDAQRCADVERGPGGVVRYVDLPDALAVEAGRSSGQTRASC